MKNSEYWLKRAQQLEDAQTKKNTEYFGRELERIYQKAIRDTEKDIASWYTRFAKNNSITMAEAKKLLNSRELEEFKWTVEEYIDYGKRNAVSGEWMKQLENASARYHISRLEALKLQMQNHVEVLMGNEVDGVTDLIRDHLEDGYYRTAFEIQKFVGIGTSFSQLDEDTIEKLLSKPWTSDGTNFSARIWGTHRTELVNDLHKKLTQAIIMGENPKVITKGFAKYVSDEAAKVIRAKKSRAENLIMTETAYFRSEGQRRCYKELGVEEFENCATLDSRTSEVCRDMDGTHFPVSEMQPGLNCPPFHNRCRTATCPHFDDEFTADEVRAARNPEGRYYTVPADMTYREWEKTFVSGKNTGLKNSGKSDIIKSLEIDDFKTIAGIRGIAEDVSDVIANVVQRYENNNEIYINEFNFDSISSNGRGTVLLQIEPIGDRMVRLNVNTDAFEGCTLKEINERIKASKNIVSKSLEEAVIHECGHAKSIYRKRISEIRIMYDELANVHIDGISPTAYSDGAEALAEMEVLISRGEKLSDVAQELYDKYMRR